jgi:hypothetical protein
MRCSQRGKTLHELLAAIAVSTLLFIGLVDMVNVSLEDAKGQQAALHQSQIVEAAQKYIASNYAALKSSTASGAVVAVTMADLRTGGFLPANFADTNSYQQNSCMLVLQDLSLGKLNALVTGYGGQPIPDKSIAAVAMGAGQGAGYIAASDVTTARGPSWSMNTTPYRSGVCQGGVKPLTGAAGDAGHLVSNIFYDGPGQLSTDFLYRDVVPGRPDLNSMNVPLQMANTALVNVGDACTQTALAIESTTKDVVVCDGGKWRYSSSSWKEPVASYGALASVPKNNGDVRVTLDTGRAFVYNGGTGTWAALAVDQNGDLLVPRDLSISRDMTAGGSLHTTGNINTDGTLTVAQSADIGQTLTARGNIDAKGNMDILGYFRGKSEVRGYWMAANSIVLDWRTTPGTPCNYYVGADVNNPVGTVIPDPTGILLMCSATDNTFRYANGQYTP